jgi:hypothetical protein
MVTGIVKYPAWHVPASLVLCCVPFVEFNPICHTSSYLTTSACLTIVIPIHVSTGHYKFCIMNASDNLICIPKQPCDLTSRLPMCHRTLALVIHPQPLHYPQIGMRWCTFANPFTDAQLHALTQRETRTDTKTRVDVCR